MKFFDSMVKFAQVNSSLKGGGKAALSSQEFVYRKFREFYNDSSNKVPSPIQSEEREFAFLRLKEKIMVRHKAFENSNSFRKFVNEMVPSDVYYSCAYYENPDFDMDKKGWLGADLVFDIDADHIPTSCNKVHDEWTCKSCGFSGKGITPENCPICNSVKFDTKTWPCELCLDSAKKETAKVVEMLLEDFGFSDEDVQVFFSGHRGYHVHVEKESVRTLDSMARKEIVDYVSGIGLNTLENRQKDKLRQKTASGAFFLSNFGWGKRLRNGMKKFIVAATKEDLKNVGIRINYDAILQHKNEILVRCLEENRWDLIRGVGIETWMRIAEYVKDIESAKIDTVVTTDIHRLIRHTGTLHGKTGLKKVRFPVSSLNEFDPFKEAVAFKEGTVKVFISDAPEFELGENVFGPYRNESAELPTAAALLLVCKSRAEVVK
jgi:DNA primase small subunit